MSDDGCGIEPHELGQVFEPFFTKKRAKETSGSGLGLAIVHGVVKEHEGFIDVTSTPGVGTTISLYFPLVDGLERKERVPAAPHGSARILIVDDEPIQLRTGRRVLVRLGYQVEIMDSGLRAYELFSRAAASGQSPFDLVIMDMLLGEVLDGLQIIEQIQRLFPAQKAIVASGHAPTERAELAVSKGLTWLGKPYGMDTPRPDGATGPARRRRAPVDGRTYPPIHLPAPPSAARAGYSAGRWRAVRYHVVSKIAQGGMAEIFLALQTGRAGLPEAGRAQAHPAGAGGRSRASCACSSTRRTSPPR